MVGFDEGRQRPANYIEICNNLADSYTIWSSSWIAERCDSERSRRENR